MKIPEGVDFSAKGLWKTFVMPEELRGIVYSCRTVFEGK
jgi:hypothetical protein